jgi:hypothetical protein
MTAFPIARAAGLHQCLLQPGSASAAPESFLNSGKIKQRFDPCSLGRYANR